MELILVGKFNSIIASKNFEEMLNEKSIPFIRKAEDMGLAVHPSFTGGVKFYISKDDWEKFLNLCNEISAAPEEFLGPGTAEEIRSEAQMRATRTARTMTWLAVIFFFGIIIMNMTDFSEKIRLIISIILGLGMVCFEFASHVISRKEI